MTSPTAIALCGWTYRVIARHSATVVALGAHIAVLVALADRTVPELTLGDLPAAIAVEVVAASSADASAIVSRHASVIAQDEASSVQPAPTDTGAGKAEVPGIAPASVSMPLVPAAPRPPEKSASSARPAARLVSPAKPRMPAPDPAPASDALTAYAAPADGWQGALRTGMAPSDIPSSWKVRLLSHLDRCKRYPDAARARRAEGTVLLSFGMDRDGRVLGYYLVRSSGYSELDDEVLAMIERASPLPPAPPEMREQVVQLVVPIRFRM